MNLFDVYSLYPVEPVQGKGSYVYDADGTEYLDLYGGHAVISIGHAHPHYVQMIGEQVGRLGFYSNSVENSLQVKLADKLGKVSGYDDYSLFPPCCASMINRDVIGVVTKTDKESPERAENWLRLAGCKKIFHVDSHTGDGVDELKAYLRKQS